LAVQNEDLWDIIRPGKCQFENPTRIAFVYHILRESDCICLSYPEGILRRELWGRSTERIPVSDGQTTSESGRD